MKHTLPITALLVMMFFVAQVVGVSLVFLDQETTVDAEGNQVVEFNPTAIGERPNMSGASSFFFIAFAVAIGTLLVLLLIKFQAFNIWKLWFLLAVWLAITIAFGVLMSTMAAFIVALALALWKVFWPNPIVHNLTEVFVYAGIAILVAPLFDLVWVVLLLVVISVYDMFAVWKSKHMVKMAEAQTKVNLFAGLYIPKGKAGPPTTHLPAPPKPDQGVAILGGGDIAFPLVFTSVALVWLIESNVAPTAALYQTLIITLFATLALIGLFAYSKKGRFYPAMPVLTAGCLLGLGVVALI